MPVSGGDTVTIEKDTDVVWCNTTCGYVGMVTVDWTDTGGGVGVSCNKL